MVQHTIQMLSEADQLLHDKKYLEALDKLKKIDDHTLHGEEYGYYCLLFAEAGIKIGNYEVKKHLDEAIEIFRYSSDTEKFARAKFLKGWCLSLLGDYILAEEVFLESYANYLRNHDLGGAARVLNYLSYGAIQTGKIERAISNLKKCITIYRQLDDYLNASNVTINLASLFLKAGRLNDSLDEYKNVEEILPRLSEKNNLAFYNMCSVAHALKGDIFTARKTIAKAKPYLNKYVRDKAVYYENLGLINILDGKYDDAEAALESGLALSLEIAPKSDLMPQIRRLFGDLYIITRKYEPAEQHANEALEVAEKIGEQVEIAACWRIFAQIAQYKNDIRKTQEWYYKAIGLFNTIGSRYELAVTRYLAAVSGMFDNHTRSGMLYVAHEYFALEGIDHYLEKIKKARQTKSKANSTGKALPQSEKGPPIIITSNPKMLKLLDFARYTADSDMAILLLGETGTGKDLLAEYIHYHSGRTGEFISVNAAAVPNDMIEAELFGHTATAFTGARKERTGLIEAADGGTFYLNELAEATPEFQAKLLEVIETRKLRRLGENETRQIDFRLIAATNIDLDQMVKEKAFRPDLYHRLKEITINLPPLWERAKDIPALVRHFLTIVTEDKIDFPEKEMKELGRLFMMNHWSGNIRELRREVNRLWMQSRKDLLRMLELATELYKNSAQERLLRTLEETNWNRRKAANILGVSEGTIRNHIKKYKLEYYC